MHCELETFFFFVSNLFYIIILSFFFFKNISILNINVKFQNRKKKRNHHDNDAFMNFVLSECDL